MFFEPHESGDVLETRVSRFDVGELEERAQVLREILNEKGWTLLHDDERPSDSQFDSQTSGRGRN